MLKALLFCVLATGPVCAAAQFNQIVETFSTPNGSDSDSAVWNTARGALHVPLVVDRSGAGAPADEDENIDLGRGTDGVFDEDTLYDLDTNAGAQPGNVTLDTSRVYAFKSFHLPSGITLRASGTQALRISVQGDIEIEGDIDLRGEAGGGSFTPASATTNGGAAGSGGGAGGSGASPIVTGDATEGKSPKSGTTGGLAGGMGGVGTDGGDGGGGGNRTDGNDGVAGVSPGSAGASYGNVEIDPLLGGAGGGGGGGNSSTGSAGAGGGGGGGVLALYAGGNFTNAGNILTTGGQGGTANGAHDAGHGGGGAGGAVLIYGGGTGTNTGLINSEGGLGGGGTADGAGSDGVHRFAFGNGAITGTGSEPPSPSPPVDPIVAYTTQTVTSVSQPYDTGATSPVYGTLTYDADAQVGDSVVVEAAASHDAFVSDTTAYVPADEVASLSGRRYVRFRFTLASASAATTPELQALRLTFTPGFAYRFLSCARAETANAPRGKFWLVLGAWWVLTRWVARRRLEDRSRAPEQR